MLEVKKLNFKNLKIKFVAGVPVLERVYSSARLGVAARHYRAAV